jgi:hypothetical protein
LRAGLLSKSSGQQQPCSACQQRFAQTLLLLLLQAHPAKRMIAF